MDSPFRKVSNPLSLWSLRNRLIVGVVALSALGFIASDVAARSALHSYLIDQVDAQLTSVAGGSTLRLDRAGIASDENNSMMMESESNESSTFSKNQPGTGTMQPLRQVPTAMSVTLLNPEGKVVGVIGGDLNTQAITNFIQGLTPAKVISHKNEPFTLDVPGADFRVLARVLPSALGSVVVAQSLDNIDQTLHRLEILFIFIGLIALLLIALASRKVISIGLKPLEAVEATAESIAAGDLSARLPEAKPDTEVGRLVESLNQMLARIEESFAARSASENRLRRFVADASHELRTPLTAIRGFAELHRQGAVKGDEQTKELIGRIEKESLRMGSLVEDLLLLARLDQSRDLKKEPINLVESVKDAVESARAAGPGHPITVTVPDDEFYILGDPDRIHQVVANLLANARTHTEIGTPIEVSVSQSSDGATVSVSDKGPGLSHEDQERIFERFFRADPSRARASEEGSGLGLSIVDAVMRAHGGKVSVTSAPGEGATFTLFFPLENTEDSTD
ncbi:MAG: HAMP domain-containing sensor histidine kinase [Candidatus Nanopelagicaceae bacterium]|nr:HAMP domain-containing sensor histidine kinase [Candidatus Nanopelagicaceae bacterium]